ncbi:MAG: SBBP repeat-containing protein [Chloroflexota bacterium]|nr:SBBP repeat-containing protein [Chloroflexota bacterium]
MYKLLLLVVIVVVGVVLFWSNSSTPSSGDLSLDDTPRSFGLTIAVTDGGLVQNPSEVINPGESAVFQYEEDNQVELLAIPSSGYRFINWTGDVDTIANINNANTTIAIAGDYSIQANFAPIIDDSVYYGLTVSSSSGGLVSEPGEGVSTHYGNTVVDLLAVPEAGYVFVNWTGDVGTIADVYSADTNISMTGHFNVQANFEVPPLLNITSTHGGSVISPGEGSFSYDFDTEIVLLAEPDWGYMFVNWTGDVYALSDINDASTEIKMIGEYSIQANFIEVEGLYSGGYGDDQGMVIATDDQGNIYVAGSSVGSSTYSDYIVIKYDDAFNEIWVQRYEGAETDRVYALVVDSSGDVYVTGYTEGANDADCLTVKYDGDDGTQLWAMTYDGSGNDADVARAMALDETGYIYIAGFTVSATTDIDYLTIKYDCSDGTQMWVRTYDNAVVSQSDEVYAIAIDSSGDVYVTGTSDGDSTSGDYATVKYSSSGVEQWVQRYDGAASEFDRARAMVVDSSGDVYVTGHTRGNDGKDDCVTVKYDTDGNEQWVQVYDGDIAKHHVGRGIAMYGDECIYIVGYGVGVDDKNDCIVIKYNSSGTEQWSARYDGDTGGDHYGDALVVGGDGNVCVVGSGEGVSGDSDYIAVMYDADGNDLWDMEYDGLGGNDYAQSVAIDGEGNIYVTGFGKNPDGDYDIVTFGCEV